MQAAPDAWADRCRIGIMRAGGSEVQFHARTEDITFDTGDKDIEGISLTGGGRVVKPIQMTDESVTLKMYPVETDLAGGGLAQWFHPQGAANGVSDDESEPFVVTNTNYRIKHRLIFLWCPTLPAAAATVPTDEPAQRIQIINAYMTGWKLNYDDKILSAEATFKWAPFTRAGIGNKREESTTGVTTDLPAATTSATSWA